MKKHKAWLPLMLVVGFLGGAMEARADDREQILRRQIEINTELLAKQPGDANLHFSVGNDYYSLAKHLKERGSWFFQTNKKNSDSEEGDRLYLESMRHLEEAVRVQPSHGGAHFNLAVNYFIQEKKEAALYHMAKADQIFMMSGNTRGLEKSKKSLKEWYKKFDYHPGDFDVARNIQPRAPVAVMKK